MSVRHSGGVGERVGGGAFFASGGVIIGLADGVWCGADAALADWNNCPAETILRVEQSRVEADSFIDALRGWILNRYCIRRRSGRFFGVATGGIGGVVAWL